MLCYKGVVAVDVQLLVVAELLLQFVGVRGAEGHQVAHQGRCLSHFKHDQRRVEAVTHCKGEERRGFDQIMGSIASIMQRGGGGGGGGGFEWSTPSINHQR